MTKCSKTKEIRTYNGEITISSIYGTEKTRQKLLWAIKTVLAKSKMILFSYYSRNMIADVILCAGYYTRYLENKNSLCPLETYSLVGNTGLIKY